MSKARLALVTMALALWIGSASAVTLPFYLTTNGINGGTVTPPSGSTVYQFWVDPSAISGGTFGFDWNIVGNGSLQMTAFTPNSAAQLTYNLNTTANTFQGSGGDPINGNFTALELGTLTINNTGMLVGNNVNFTCCGDVTLWSGDYIDSNHVTQLVTTPQVLALADFIPEPGTAILLGVGLGGLAVAVRARRPRMN